MQQRETRPRARPRVPRGGDLDSPLTIELSDGKMSRVALFLMKAAAPKGSAFNRRNGYGRYHCILSVPDMAVPWSVQKKSSSVPDGSFPTVARSIRLLGVLIGIVPLGLGPGNPG